LKKIIAIFRFKLRATGGHLIPRSDRVFPLPEFHLPFTVAQKTREMFTGFHLNTFFRRVGKQGGEGHRNQLMRATGSAGISFFFKIEIFF
jgi:hypothetical protein